MWSEAAMGKLFQGLGGGVLVQCWVFSPHLTCCSYSWTQQLRGHQSPCGIDLSGLNPDLSKPSGLGPAESTSEDRTWCMYLLLLITRSPSFLHQDYWKPVEHKRGACSEGCADPLEPISVRPLPFQVVEVGHFWGYRIDERNAELLKKLTAEINRLELVPLPVHPHPDLVCLAPFTDHNKKNYFRAQILYVSGHSAEVCFSVNRSLSK